MIVSMLRFDVHPGAVPALGQVFARHQVLETAIQVEGCQTLVLASPGGEADTAYVLGLWDDEAAYQRWLDHPSRSMATDDLAQLVEGDYDAHSPAQQWHVLRAIHHAD